MVNLSIKLIMLLRIRNRFWLYLPGFLCRAFFIVQSRSNAKVIYSHRLLLPICAFDRFECTWQMFWWEKIIEKIGNAHQQDGALFSCVLVQDAFDGEIASNGATWNDGQASNTQHKEPLHFARYSIWRALIDLLWTLAS